MGLVYMSLMFLRPEFWLVFFFFYRLLATLISLVSVSGLVVQDFLPTSISSLFGTKLSILMLTMV